MTSVLRRTDAHNTDSVAWLSCMALGGFQEFPGCQGLYVVYIKQYVGSNRTGSLTEHYLRAAMARTVSHRLPYLHNCGRRLGTDAMNWGINLRGAHVVWDVLCARRNCRPASRAFGPGIRRSSTRGIHRGVRRAVSCSVCHQWGQHRVQQAATQSHRGAGRQPCKGRTL